MVAAASGPGRPRRSSSRARSRRAPRRAPGACRGRGGPPLGREQSGGGRRRRAAQVGHGAASGAAPPHLFPPEAPPREPYPPEAVRRPLRGPLDGTGAVNAHMYSSEPTSVTPLQRRGARLFCPPAHRGASRQGQITARVTPSSRGQHIARKQAAPAARLAETAREAPAGGERRKRTRRPRARS